MDISKPILTEPGVKYFLKETLKNCKLKKDMLFNKYINLGLLIFFIIIVTVLLFYKYKTRPTDEDRKKTKQLKRDYFLTRVRQLEAKKAKQLNKQITNLPKFESPFELLHKNFYKT
jgi:signal transduction histidine kinase